MPNWVYNRIEGYSPEMFEKYKDEESEFNFDKLIPMPKELLNTPTGTFADMGRDIHEYNAMKENLIAEGRPEYIKNSVVGTALNRRFGADLDRFYNRVGQVALAFPNKSMNEILQEFKDEEIESPKDRYYGMARKEFANDVEEMRKVLGREDCKHSNSHYIINDRKSEIYPDRAEVLDRYIDSLENQYSRHREVVLKENNKFKDRSCEHYETLKDIGDDLAVFKEKYGFDNWYDWRLANWSTKWEAEDAEFDQGSSEMRFDTAWSVPEPVFAKLQEENPDAKFHIYSEEETGWWNEYETQDDGKLHLVATGQYEYEEKEDGEYEQVSDGREERDEVLDYEEIHQRSVDETNRFNNYKLNFL